MNKCEGRDRCANVSWTAAWFFNFASVDFDLQCVGAGATPEEGDFHVWNYGSCTDDEAFDAYEFVSVCKGCSKLVH
jgi:hypothetical protein